MLDVVVFLVSLGVRVIRAMCRRRADLVLENVALRQQVTALKKERPRPPLEDTERAFWVALRASWPVWASRLLIVHADTVARWHRDRFRRYWAKISQRCHPGRPRIDAEIRLCIVKTAPLERYACPTSFHVIRTRLLGNIATPRLDASPLRAIESCWEGELPGFDNVGAASELFESLMGVHRQNCSVHEIKDLRSA